MILEYTDNAVTQFKKIIDDNSDAIGIYIGLKTAGCTGYMYYIDVFAEPKQGCEMEEVADVKVFFSGDIVNIIKGTVIDYATIGFTKKFVYNNPNVKMLCGCGDSFSVDL